eukprot:1692378-Pyramimonas_sp.AAC.1
MQRGWEGAGQSRGEPSNAGHRTGAVTVGRGHPSWNDWGTPNWESSGHVVGGRTRGRPRLRGMRTHDPDVSHSTRAHTHAY